MLRKISKFLALNGEEKKLFIEAYLLLGTMRAALLTISFKRLTRSLEHLKDRENSETLTEEQLQGAIMVGRAIERAANYTPWQSACLAQSLTAQRMLQKRGIPGVFYLGAMKDESAEEKMKAHSWSQCGETIITGAKGHEDYTVLSVFGWGKR
ncbi:MAG: lasso peptide biosynthesis B2 protein [Campylobacterota bacterium]